MNHHNPSTLIAILILLLCSTISSAQEATSKSQTVDAARREKAIELLKSLATQVATLQSPENRARIGANIAESLWAHDEQRARALFNSVQTDINLGLQNRDPYDPRDEKTFAVFLKLRHDTVRRIAKRNPELALLFLNATDPTIPLSPVLAEYDRAQQSQRDAAGDPDLNESRHNLLARLDRMEKRASISDTDVVDAQRAVERISGMQDRVLYLIFVANRIAADNRDGALKLLDTANGFLEAAKPGKDRVSYQIGLGLVYCAHKSDRGLSIIESLMPKLNELIAAAAKLDGFDTNYLREGEWNMSANGEVGQVLTLMADNASDFASCDFDRALSLAAQFERAEIRMMAQVKLARAILAGPKRN